MPKLFSASPKRSKAEEGSKQQKENWGGALAQKPQRYENVFGDSPPRFTPAPVSLDDQDSFSAPIEDTEVKAEEPLGNVIGGGPSLVEPDQPTAGDLEDFDGGPASGDSESIDDQEAVSDETMDEVLDQLKDIISDVTTVLTTRESEIDGFTKFGLNLYFAGACSKLNKAFSLSANEGKSLLARLMEMTGVDKESAHAFSDKVNEYGQYDQYREMIDAGGAVMAKHLEEQGDSASGSSEDSETTENPDSSEDPSSSEVLSFSEVLDEWCNPDNSVELPSTHTFMFADIVDSTSLTEELGDETMQKVIRAHNRVVKKALKGFGGNEVKHTGDGIMATFNNARFAVDAAVQIQ